jgi:SAM-dependent methyltransferase
MTFSNWFTFLSAFARREEGQTMAEYGVVLGVITIALVAVFGFLADDIAGAIDAVRAVHRAQRLPLRDASVDLVFSNLMLQWLDDPAPAFAEFRRVLRPGGPVLVGFHVGDETRRSTTGYTGRPIKVDSYRRRPDRVSQWLREAGFTIEAELLMRPDDEVPGAIVFARKPPTD